MTTGGGGQHIIFGATEVPIPCKTRLVPGVDVKAIGGYIVGVGSQHISGKRYRWAPQCRPKEVELKAPPRWLVDMLDTPKNKPLGSRPPEYYEKLVAPMLEGERNERMTRLLGHLFGSAFPDRVVLLHLVLCFNEVNVHPPLDREEIYKIARSLAGREKRKSGAA